MCNQPLLLLEILPQFLCLTLLYDNTPESVTLTNSLKWAQIPQIHKEKENFYSPHCRAHYCTTIKPYESHLNLEASAILHETQNQTF